MGGGLTNYLETFLQQRYYMTLILSEKRTLQQIEVCLLHATMHTVTFTNLVIVECMYVCMYGCMDVWMDVCMYVCMVEFTV